MGAKTGLKKRVLADNMHLIFHEAHISCVAGGTVVSIAAVTSPTAAKSGRVAITPAATCSTPSARSGGARLAQGRNLFQERGCRLRIKWINGFRGRRPGEFGIIAVDSCAWWLRYFRFGQLSKHKFQPTNSSGQ